MTFRALDSDGDWEWGNGRSSYATDERAIELNVQTRLGFWLNDFFNAMQFGIDWRNLLGGKSPAADQAIILQTRVMLVQSYGVVRIVTVSASKNSQTRRLTISFVIDTLFSSSVRMTFIP